MSRITYSANRIIDADGISDGAAIYVYQSESSTPVSLFGDSDYSSPVSNPYVVPAGAAVPVLYTDYIGPLAVRIIATDGSVPYEEDPYPQDITIDDLNEIVLSASRYGVSPSATPSQNLINFKRAIAACPVGGIVELPAHPDPYEIDTSGGLSTAIEINKRITVRIIGDLKASFSAIQANPPYIFNVTAAGASIVGPGRIIGDGTINDLNAGSDDNIPGLIRIEANNCKVKGLTFVNVPKTGILLYGVYFCDISENNFTGGPVAYNDTAYFGIRVAGGGRHRVCDNWFYPDADGGMLVNCIFASGSNNNNLSRNFAYRPYEKLI
jgi:hypothetical protein